MRKADTLVVAKAAYATGARGIGRGLKKVGALSATPPSRDRLIAHWAYSLMSINDSLALAELGVPWWTYRAIAAVEAWLSTREHPIRVFEYGSGSSTLWLASRADDVHTVEHHRGFAEHVGPSFDQWANIKLALVEPTITDHPVTASEKEGHAGLDFSDYVGTIDRVGGSFDLIVIDGRARAACLVAAIPNLKSSGMIVFDNSWRRRYRTAIERAGLHEQRFRGLVPTLPYPDQTSLLTPTPAPPA